MTKQSDGGPPNPWRETVRDVFDELHFGEESVFSGSPLARRILELIEERHKDYFCLPAPPAQTEEKATLPNGAPSPSLENMRHVDIRPMTVAQLRAALDGLPYDAPVYVQSYVPYAGDQSKRGGRLVHAEGVRGDDEKIDVLLWSAETSAVRADPRNQE